MEKQNPNIQKIIDVYDITITILPYANNNEYRNSIRKVFKVNSRVTLLDDESESLLCKEDVDDESWDEMLYDSDTMTKAMDLIFEETKDHVLFEELYEAAAAHMISTDKLIGQAILMSYDYYYMYHMCLCTFFQSPDTFNEKSECYLKLKNALTK